MKPHVRIYLRHFGYGETEFIPCEICGSKAVDVHHINGRCKGCDTIQNLMALCRDCHNKAEREEIKPEEFQFIHLNFIQQNHKKLNP